MVVCVTLSFMLTALVRESEGSEKRLINIVNFLFEYWRSFGVWLPKFVCMYV